MQQPHNINCYILLKAASIYLPSIVLSIRQVDPANNSVLIQTFKFQIMNQKPLLKPSIVLDPKKLLQNADGQFTTTNVEQHENIFTHSGHNHAYHHQSLEETPFPLYANQGVASGVFLQQVQHAFNMDQTKKIPQELSPNQFFQHQPIISGCDPENREKQRSNAAQPDQIENKDPNLFGRTSNASRMKNVAQSNSQAHLIKLIQEQKENKNKIRFCSVGKAHNSNSNLLQSHGKPATQSRNESGKTAPLKNFRQIQKIHKSMQKKERSAVEFQMQQRLPIKMTFQTFDAGEQEQPRYKLLQPPQVVHMSGPCFQSAQTSVRNKGQASQMQAVNFFGPFSTRNSTQPTLAPKQIWQDGRTSQVVQQAQATMNPTSSGGFAPSKQRQSHQSGPPLQAQSQVNMAQPSSQMMLSQAQLENSKPTTDQKMDVNQENIVKINNLDLGDSTLENEDKTMSNYGVALKQEAEKAQSQLVKQTHSSNSLERDSNSNAEEDILQGTKEEILKKEDQVEHGKNEGPQDQDAQKEGPREGQEDVEPPNQQSFQDLNQHNIVQNPNLDQQNQREYVIPISSEEDQHDVHQDSNIDCSVKRNNSATFNSAQKKRFKHVFNSGVKASIDGRPSRGGAAVNNEQTSSSLGKRNFGSYQKVQREQKEQRRMQRMDKEKREGSKGSTSANYTSSKMKKPTAGDISHRPALQCQNPAIIRQPSPQKGMLRTLFPRRNSDKFDIEQAKESGKKLMNICDEGPEKSEGESASKDKNDDSLLNEDQNDQQVFIGNGLAVPFHNVTSDILMSSSCGDRTPGENNSFNNHNPNLQNANAQLPFMRQGSEVNFQKMGHNGQCNHHYYHSGDGQNLLLCKQFSQISGYENISDNQNTQAINLDGNQRNRSISPQIQHGQLERQMQNSGSTIEEIQNQIQLKMAMKAQQAVQQDSAAKISKPVEDQHCETDEKQRLTPIGKNTPNFPKKGANKIIFRNKFDISNIDKQVEINNAEGPSPNELFKDCLVQQNSQEGESGEKHGEQEEQRDPNAPNPLHDQLFGQQVPFQDPNRKQVSHHLPFLNQNLQNQEVPVVRFFNFGQGLAQSQPQGLLPNQASIQQWQPLNEAQIQQYYQFCMQHGLQFGTSDQAMFQSFGQLAPKEMRRSTSAVAQPTQQQKEEQINIQNEVRRQLSFRSVSNTSSNIETPMQHKRMKLRDADSSGQLNNGPKSGMYRATFLNSSSCPQNSRKLNNQVFVLQNSEGKIDHHTPSAAQREGPSPAGNFTIFSQKKAQHQNFFQKPPGPNSNVVQKIYYTNPDNMSSYNEHSMVAPKDAALAGNQLRQKPSTTTDKDHDESQKSVYQKWISSNPVFNNKYSSGATPARKSKGSNRRGISQIGQDNQDVKIERLQLKKSQSAIVKKEVEVTKVVGPSFFYELQMNNASHPDEADANSKALTLQGHTDQQNVIQSDRSLSVIDDESHQLLFHKTLQKICFRAAGSIPNPQLNRNPNNQIEADYQAAQHNTFFKTMQDKNQKGKPIIVAEPENLRYSSPNIVNEIRRTSSEIFENTPFKKPVSSDIIVKYKGIDCQAMENHMAPSSGDTQQHQAMQVGSKGSNPYGSKDSNPQGSKGSNPQQNNQEVLRLDNPFQVACPPTVEIQFTQNNLALGNPAFQASATPNMNCNQLKMVKTHSSISNLSQSRHSQGPQNLTRKFGRPNMQAQMSISIKQGSVTQDGKSNGGPKTPVNNPGNFFKVNSVSITNTSMNDQSVISSSLDTEGAGNLNYRYGKKRRPAPQYRQINQFQNLPAQALFRQQLLAEQPQQSSELPNLQRLNSQFNDQLAFQTQLQNSLSQPKIISPFQPDGGATTQHFNPTNTSQTALQKSYERYESGNPIILTQRPLPTLQYTVAQQSPAPQPKSWFEKEFTLIEVIGKGHFGRVMRCQNNTDKFEYAIKVTNTRIRNPNEKELYLQEMQTLSALSVGAECPHIVRYFNSWIEDERIHIVMELCEKSLRQIKHEAKAERKRIASQMNKNGVTSPDSSMRFGGSDPHASGGCIPESQLRQIIRDILVGLEEVHSQGIVHLDIKPENILLGKSGKYKLADLGMSRLLTKITDPHTLPEGDCRYLARELLSREVLQHLPDLKKSDIFSLGITAYELIALVSLEKNGKEWQALREGKVKFPQYVTKYYSEELLETVCRMLSPNTDARPGAHELLHTVFISSEQHTIQEVQAENQRLKDQLGKLTEFLRSNHGIDADAILQSLA